VLHLDKAVIGERIKHLRKSRALRQWQMAELLGATQPAIHKYENGILPEVKRLLELARIGSTSIEWILTGHHCENGSTTMERPGPEIFELAQQLSSLSAQDRQILADALRLVISSVGAVRQASGLDTREMTDAEIGRALRGFEGQIREPLTAAMAISDAVVTTLSNGKVRELHRFGQFADADVPGGRPSRSTGLHKNAG